MAQRFEFPASLAFDMSETVNVNNIKRGFVLNLNDELFQVVETAHHKPGKGNAVVRTRLRRLSDSAVLDRTFNSDTKVGYVRLDRREMQFLYIQNDDFVFMDNESYDQITLSADQIGKDATQFLKEGTSVEIAMHDGTPVIVDLPTTVDLVIKHTEAGSKGDRATAGTKPAELETGTTVQVPVFVSTGDVVRVDTRTGDYVTRVSK